MGAAASACAELLNFEHADLSYMRHDEASQGKRCPEADPVAPAPQGPQLALRVVYAPVEQSSGALPSPFGLGDEVAVARLDKMRGWEPSGWRQERSANQRAALDNAGRVLWPSGPRICNAQRFWGARVIASDGADGFEEHWCMLQVAVSPEERDQETGRLAVEDARDAASYAHRFNLHAARAVAEDADPEDVPGVRVCPPVVCEVLGSVLPDVARIGDFVTLAPYPAPEVRKFVFEGGEDFLEMPQAFFHYVAWASGGKELVADLQGVEDDRGFVLVDPVVLRAGKLGIGDLLAAAAGAAGPGGRAAQEGGPCEERFNLWHPRCGQLCRSFDPQRRSVHSRKHCGLSTPSCGVGRGG